MLQKEFIYINSSERLAGTTSEFTHLIPIADKQYTHVSLVSCNIPKAYYSIQNNYNTFQVLENSILYTITIPEGNYGYKKFITALVTALNNTCLYTYSITYLDSTAKFVFTCIEGNPQFIFEYNLYEQCGFNYTSTNQFIGNYLTSTNIIDLSPENNLYIRSDLSATGLDNILTSIGASGVPPYGMITYSNPDILQSAKEISGTNSNTYSFSLTNENDKFKGGRVLDLNGKNFTFCLVVFRKDNISTLIKDFMRIALDNQT